MRQYFFRSNDADFRKWCRYYVGDAQRQIYSIDDVLWGRILWEQRLRCDLSAAQVSELLHIAPGTLYAFEHGTRPVKLNVLYGMSQMYGIGIDGLIQKHFLE